MKRVIFSLVALLLAGCVSLGDLKKEEKQIAKVSAEVSCVGTPKTVRIVSPTGEYLSVTDAVFAEVKRSGCLKVLGDGIEDAFAPLDYIIVPSVTVRVREGKSGMSLLGSIASTLSSVLGGALSAAGSTSVERSVEVTVVLVRVRDGLSWQTKRSSDFSKFDVQGSVEDATSVLGGEKKKTNLEQIDVAVSGAVQDLLGLVFGQGSVAGK